MTFWTSSTGRLRRGASCFGGMTSSSALLCSSSWLAVESMLVLGDVASETAEKVFEKRELELEDRWNMPMSTVYVRLFQYIQG